MVTERDAIEAALAASWHADQLAVYGDYLETNGDPRGELIAIDLQVERLGPSPELGARKQALIESWLGAELAARVLEIGAVTHGFVELHWPLAADELERMFGVDVLVSALRVLAIEDHDPGLRRAIDAICRVRPPWLERLHVARYPDAFNDELRSSLAIDDDRARALVDATPRLRALTAAGTRAFGELVHPQLRSLCVYDHDALASLVRDGAPFASLIELDLQLSAGRGDLELASLLPAHRFPVLRRLDLSRNEANHAHVLDLVRHHPLVSQLTWLRVPSLRAAADLEALEVASSRMPPSAELVVARAYADFVPRSQSPGITIPPSRPWPRRGLRGSLAIALPGEPRREALPLDTIIRVLERAFDGLAEPARAVWVDLWRRLAELPEPRLFATEPSPGFPFAGEALVLALAPLELARGSAWAALRTALCAHDGATLEIRRAVP